MYRRVMASAIFVIGILVGSGYGQPPGGQPPSSPGQLPMKGKIEAPSKKADPTDALVQAALAHDPDVKLAQAKVLLAEAEVAKARQAIVLKVMAMNATIQDLRSQAALLAEKAGMLERDANSVSLATRLEARVALERAKSALAHAELELKLLTTGVQKETHTGTGTSSMDPPPFQDAYLEYAHALVTRGQMKMNKVESRGPIADRIRTALDKKVKLGNPGEHVTFMTALERIKKETGLDVPVHFQGQALREPGIKPDGQELTVGAWIQLLEDSNQIVFCVREYGLLVTTKELAPPNALTVLELWKQPLKKDADEQKKAEPFLRKYPVPGGTVDAVARILQGQNARIQAFPVAGVGNEIIVLGTDSDHDMVARMLKEITEKPIPEPKTKSPPGPGR